MKFKTFFFLQLSLMAFNSVQAQGDLLGTYKGSVKFLSKISSKSACVRAGGEWLEDDFGCLLQAENKIEITNKEASKVSVDIELTNHNGYGCGITGKLDYFSPEKLIISDTDGEGCLIDISRQGDNITVEKANSACRAYCGASGYFYAENLKKQGKSLPPELTEDVITKYLNQIQANEKSRLAFNKVMNEIKAYKCSSSWNWSQDRSEDFKLSLIFPCTYQDEGRPEEFGIILDFSVDQEFNLTGDVTEITAG